MSEINKILYATVLSQTISSDGKYLFCGNNFGEVFVYSIEKISASSEKTLNDGDLGKLSTSAIHVFQASERCQIYSLAFHKDFLIVGLNGEICGWTWNGKNQKITKKAWQVKMGSQQEAADMMEVNYLWLNTSLDQLYAGCGDNNIYCISLEDGKIIREYSGHKDYIHCVDGCGDKLASASEDGLIKLWDSRQKKATNNLEPHKNEKLNRPEFGKWQGTVSITEDWLVCGGGPRFSLWHLRSLECTTDFAFPNKVHVSGFIDDVIFAGGDCRNFYQYNFNGDITAEIPISGPSVYSVVWQNEPWKFMSVAGASSNLDICTNFNYRDIILNIYKK